MGKNLTLTGMMGVGKSTIGRLLSKKLGMPFEDLDERIEIKESLNIKQIFTTLSDLFITIVIIARTYAVRKLLLT